MPGRGEASGDGARLMALTDHSGGWGAQGGSLSVRSPEFCRLDEEGSGRRWTGCGSSPAWHLPRSRGRSPGHGPLCPLTLRSTEAVPPSWHLAPRGWHPEGTGLVCSVIHGQAGAHWIRPQEPHSPFSGMVHACGAGIPRSQTRFWGPPSAPAPCPGSSASKSSAPAPGCWWGCLLACLPPVDTQDPRSRCPFGSNVRGSPEPGA